MSINIKIKVGVIKIKILKENTYPFGENTGCKDDVSFFGVTTCAHM